MDVMEEFKRERERGGGRKKNKSIPRTRYVGISIKRKSKRAIPL